MSARTTLVVVAFASLAHARKPEIGMVVNVDLFRNPNCTELGEVFVDNPDYRYNSTEGPWWQIVVTEIDADGVACWGLATPAYYDLNSTTARWREPGAFDPHDRSINRLFQFYKQWNITTSQVWWRDHTCSNDTLAPRGDYSSWGNRGPPRTIGGKEPLLMDKLNTARLGECVSAHIDELPLINHPNYTYYPHFGPDNVTYMRIARFQYVQLDLDGRRLSADETNENLVYDPPYFYPLRQATETNRSPSQGVVVMIVVLSVLGLLVVVLGLWALSRRSTNALALYVGPRTTLSAYPSFVSLRSI